MKLAIYDFDGTYIDVQTLPYLFKLWKESGLNLRQHRKIWRKIMRRYLWHKFNLFGWNKQTFRANAMQLTIDMFHSVSSEELTTFLKLFHDRLQEHIPAKIKDQLKQDKDDGYLTVLLSGNYDIILEQFLIDGFDRVIGTDSKNGDGLKRSEEVEIIINQKKAEAIRTHFPEADYQASKAYADSYYDLPILDLVGHPVAVGPDEELRALALEKAFEIIEL